ncbi:MAG: hypothetical protein ACRD3Q_19475 [Terriglobales bacterium]
MNRKPRYWFAAKRYGWGWALPLTWEGWVVYTVWLAVFLAVVSFLRFRAHRPEHVAIIIGMVAMLLGISYWKGEPPRWRWGNGR